MDRRGLTLLITSVSALEPPRRMRVPRPVALACFLFMLAGAAGLGRAVFFAGSYALARIGVRNEQHKNAKLRQVLDFLKWRAEVHSQSIEQFVAAEDIARLRLGLNTISADIRQAGTGGPPSAEDVAVAGLTDSTLVKADAVLQALASLLARVTLQKKTFGALENHVHRLCGQWAQMPTTWPVHGRITSGFGYRLHPVVGERMFHEGIDIANEEWTPILATADGVASFVGVQRDYGKVVIIDHHGNGYQTVYAHLAQMAVAQGQIVSRGQLIGYMGNSGRSTGTHLHYEIRRQGKFTDPLHSILPLDVIVE